MPPGASYVQDCSHTLRSRSWTHWGRPFLHRSLWTTGLPNRDGGYQAPSLYETVSSTWPDDRSRRLNSNARTIT